MNTGWILCTTHCLGSQISLPKVPLYHICMQERVTAVVHLSRPHCIRQTAFIQEIYQAKGLCLHCEIKEQKSKERLRSHLMPGRASDVDFVPASKRTVLPYIFYKSCYGTILLEITDVCVNGKLTSRALKSIPAQKIAALTATDTNDPCSDSVCSEIPRFLCRRIEINCMQDRFVGSFPVALRTCWYGFDF